MEEVKLQIDSQGNGFFLILEGDERIAEMEINIAGNDLTVFHTEVLQKAEGRGLGKELLAGMVDYARKNQLKVFALCPFVHAQFKRHAKEYADVWKNINE